MKLGRSGPCSRPAGPGRGPIGLPLPWFRVRFVVCVDYSVFSRFLYFGRRRCHLVVNFSPPHLFSVILHSMVETKIYPEIKDRKYNSTCGSLH
jgi:hypothetical protein